MMGSMTNFYHSKYYGDTSGFLEDGWTAEEINTYFPILETMSDEDLLKLHTLCSVHMFDPGESVDQEQAIHVLVNPKDTPKALLIASIKELKGL